MVKIMFKNSLNNRTNHNQVKSNNYKNVERKPFNDRSD